MGKQFKPKTTGITVDTDDTVEEVEKVTEDSATEGNVENPVETVENEETPKEDSNVKVNPNIDQKPAVKNVKILPKENHTCCIGGVRYYLKKGVQTNVPVEVKEILNKAGLLMPL